MNLDATTMIVGALFAALCVTLLLWRLAETRKLEALTVTLTLGRNDDVERFNELEEKLATAVEQSASGMLTGDEFRADGCTFYFRGRSAERLYQAALPLLKDYGPAEGSFLVKRYGGDGAPEERIQLSDIL
jgi:hypothetical protein